LFPPTLALTCATHTPVPAQAMAALTARLFPQAHALFEWLERHAQIRSAQPKD